MDVRAWELSAAMFGQEDYDDPVVIPDLVDWLRYRAEFRSADREIRAMIAEAER